MPQNRAARRFVNAAAFHTNETIFNQVDPADAVVTAQFVQLGQQGSRRQFFTVDRDGITFSKINGDFRWVCRRPPTAPSCENKHSRAVHPTDLPAPSFGGNMQKIGVNRERRLAPFILGNGNLIFRQNRSTWYDWSNPIHATAQ